MMQVRDGDIDKLCHLFERFNGKLYNFFLRMTNNRELSEDLVQEVFLRMLKYKEIAQLLNCKVGTIKARVHRALKELGIKYSKISGENLS